jgi:hypothetical protein
MTQLQRKVIRSMKRHKAKTKISLIFVSVLLVV